MRPAEAGAAQSLPQGRRVPGTSRRRDTPGATAAGYGTAGRAPGWARSWRCARVSGASWMSNAFSWVAEAFLTPFVFGLKACEGLPARVSFSSAFAGALVQVSAATRAEAPAVGAAKWLRRFRHQDILSYAFAQVQDEIRTDSECVRRGRVSNRRACIRVDFRYILLLEGDFNRHVHILQAARTGFLGAPSRQRRRH